MGVTRESSDSTAAGDGVELDASGISSSAVNGTGDPTDFWLSPGSLDWLAGREMTSFSSSSTDFASGLVSGC